MAKHSIPLSRRQRDYDQLAFFSVHIIPFNDLYHIRLVAPNGETVNYYPTSQKWQRLGHWYKGLDKLIDYLEEVS